MEEHFGEILVPTEEVVEMRGGQKRKVERKFFPGYVLVQMELNDAAWHLVKETPRVMGFIGGKADKPAPITDKEAELFYSVLMMVLISLSRKRYLNLVRWFVSLMVLLMTLTVLLKKLIMRRVAFRLLF